MTAPNVWNTGYERVDIPAAGAASTILAEINTLLTTTLPVADRWTDLGSDEYESQAEPGGRKVRVKVVDNGGNSMNVQVRQDAGGLIINSMFRWNTNAQMYIFAGKHHFAIIADASAIFGAGIWDHALATMVDTSPIPAASHDRKVAARGSSDSFGNAFWLSSNVDHFFMADNDGNQFRQRVPHWHDFSVGDGYHMETVDGQELHSFVPVVECTTARLLGQLYQFAIVDKALSGNVVVELPIDQGVNGKFQVIPQLAHAYAHKIAIRVPDDVDLG